MKCEQNKNTSLTSTASLETARQVLEVEANCILAASARLDGAFTRAIDSIVSTVESGGKVIVSGLGKSGKIAAKIAATLASTGTPALYLHPTEASHGDLGVITSKDCVLFLSYSGASAEILALLPSLKNRFRDQPRILSIVGQLKSPLAAESDLVLDGSVTQEACPLNLAPTSSTTVALALGDALALTVSQRLRFSRDDFAENHPGGLLGRKLRLTVDAVMQRGDALPWVNPEDTMDTVVHVLTEKQLGAVLVRPQGNARAGLITDGDVRRALKHKAQFFEMKAAEVMTANPVSIGQHEKAGRALELMENRSSQISVLPVLNQQGDIVGLVRVHDLVGR